MPDHNPAHPANTDKDVTEFCPRRVTHTGAIDLRVATVTAHVLDDGTRVIPLASAARLLTEDASATEFLLTPPNGFPDAQGVADRITTYQNLHGCREAGLRMDILVELLAAHAEGRPVDDGPERAMPHPLEAKARGRALEVIRFALGVGIEVETGGSARDALARINRNPTRNGRLH